MKKIKMLAVCCSLFFLIEQRSICTNLPPKLTIIIVIDQFAYHYITKLYPHLRGGLRYLIDNGLLFSNAHHDHGLPVTGVGHVALNTGVHAEYHGIIGNNWCLHDGRVTTCDEDSNIQAAVFNPAGEGDDTYDYNKSAHHVKVDGLTDQYVLHSSPDVAFRAFSFSLKDYPAIVTANKLGKPIWFDSTSGMFTSSKAYFEQLPDWLKEFNTAKSASLLNEVQWNRAYSKKRHAYNFFNISNYNYAIVKEGIVDTTIQVKSDFDANNPYFWFERTPNANQMLIDLAQTCIKKHVNRRSHDRLLVWLCLSSLDFIGHVFGPESMEAIDMIYHLDQQLKHFLRSAMSTVGKSNLLVALSSDHGVCPIPELLQEKGMHAHRINVQDIVKSINISVSEKYGIEECVTGHAGNQLYLDMQRIEQLEVPDRYACITAIKQAAQVNGIKRVWMFDELYHEVTQQGSFEDNLRKQLFPGRSGNLILQTYPYVLLTDHATGTTHESVYGYDTHVPLIIFQHRSFEQRKIRKRVSMLQFANTMAEILGIEKPSASTAEILPGVFDWELR